MIILIIFKAVISGHWLVGSEEGSYKQQVTSNKSEKSKSENSKTKRVTENRELGTENSVSIRPLRGA